VSKNPVDAAQQSAARQAASTQEQQVRQNVENQTRATEAARAPASTANAPRAGIASAASASGTPGEKNPAVEAQQQDTAGPANLHMPTADGSSRYNLNGGASVSGSERSAGVSASTSLANGRTVTAQEQSRTDNTTRESTTVQTRDATATNRAGQSVQSTSENASITDRRTGERLQDNQRVAVDSTGRTTANATETHTAPQTTRERAGQALNNATNVGAVAETRLAGDDNWHGVGAVGSNPRSMANATGAAGEAHVLAVQANANAGATANLRSGEVRAGVNGTVRADLVGASGRAQVGTTTNVAGAAFAEGEANVGARAGGNAGVAVDLRRGTANLGAGVDGFAGAEVRGSVGYENRYAGVGVTGRGQAGIGGAAGASAGITNGRIHARADLGATVGLGGRVTIDVNVNAAAIAQDGYQVARSAVNGAAYVAQTYNPVAVGSRLGDRVGRWWYGN